MSKLINIIKQFFSFAWRFDSLKLLIALVVGVGIVIINFLDIVYLDFDVFPIATIFLVYAGNQFLNLISEFLKMRNEEKEKLIQNYHLIVDKYRDNKDQMLTYKNEYKNINSSTVISKTKSIEVIQGDKRINDTYRFPIIFDKDRVLAPFTFEYNKGNYDLPSDIKSKKSEILRAHHSSNAYNRTTQRIKSITKIGESYHVALEKTSYYNMLVSNRAIDFYIEGFGTIRDRYEEGPVISTLEESKLANHFGYAIIVETSDDKFVFSKRKEHVSVGKNTLGTGVSSVLKVNLTNETYNDKELKEIFNKSINNEIQNEIGIKNDGLKYNFDFDLNNIVVYRDLTEGGKPQFLFYVKLNIDSNDFLKESKEYFLSKKILNCKNIKSKEAKQYDVDFVLYSEEELRQAYITPDYLSIGNDCHKVIPLFSAAIVLFLQNIDKIKEKHKN